MPNLRMLIGVQLILDQGKSLVGTHFIFPTGLTYIFLYSKVETKKTDLVKHFHKHIQ